MSSARPPPWLDAGRCGRSRPSQLDAVPVPRAARGELALAILPRQRLPHRAHAARPGSRREALEDGANGRNSASSRPMSACAASAARVQPAARPRRVPGHRGSGGSGAAPRAARCRSRASRVSASSSSDSRRPQHLAREEAVGAVRAAPRRRWPRRGRQVRRRHGRGRATGVAPSCARRGSRPGAQRPALRGAASSASRSSSGLSASGSPSPSTARRSRRHAAARAARAAKASISRCSAPARTGQAERRCSASAEQGMRRRPAHPDGLVGAGTHHRAEGPQHRARQRRDDHLRRVRVGRRGMKAAIAPARRRPRR